MKKILMICCFTLMISVMSGCIGFDEKHISQKEAQKLAEGLTGGEVTYVKTDEISETEVDYYFTDAKGTTFPIQSTLRQQSIDDSAPFGPYDCYVYDDYEEVVWAENQDAVMELIEKHSLTEYFDYIHDTGLTMRYYVGTPEENREMLERFAALGAEIDTLLDMNFNRDYDDKIRKDKYYSYSSVLYTSYNIGFYKLTNNPEHPESCIDVAHPDFSVSEDTRWTAESLYEAILEDIDSMEIAE